MNDNTEKIEKETDRENSNKLSYLFRLWKYVFVSTKKISVIYLGLFILLSILRPVIGIIWGKYIALAESRINLPRTVILNIIFITLYCALNWCAELIESFMSVNGDGDIEQLDAVQANRQQELMHCRMFKKISNLTPEYMEIPQFTDRITQVFKFAGDRANGINRKIMLNGYILIAKFVSVISVGATLFFIHPWLTIFILIAPLPTLWNSFLKEKMGFEFVKKNTEISRKIKYFQELMLSPANKEIKILDCFDFFYAKWKKCADMYTYNERKVIKHQTFLGIVNSFVISILNIIGVVIAIVFFVSGEITVGELSLILSLIGVLVNDTENLFNAFSSFISKKNEAALFFTFMDMPNESLKGNAIDSIHQITVKNIKYRYPHTSNYVLNGINFTISEGEKIAFVGENGAGKSTFVKLLLGMLSPSEGEVFINQGSIDNILFSSRLSAQSTVSQNPTHYTTFSVKENIFLGDTENSYQDHRIQEAIDFADLTGIDVDAKLGRDIGGIELSGGQWQKVAIARAVYRNKNFIVLDEPTSNLDPKAESEVFIKYLQMTKNKTVIFVTHRVAVAALAERIVVFDNGKIIEDGTHKELIKKRGKYAELYYSQAQWYNR